MIWNIIRIAVLIFIFVGAFVVFGVYHTKNKDRNHDDDIDMHDFS